MTVAEPTASDSADHRIVEHDMTEDGGDKIELMPSSGVSQSSEAVITHLVSLPRLGFTSAVLARRMLQWKRMGFDLSALEPALSLTDMDDAFSVYRSVELDIVRAIDALRLLETHESALTVTEREMFNYRMMSLLDVEQNVQDLETPSLSEVSVRVQLPIGPAIQVDEARLQSASILRMSSGRRPGLRRRSSRGHAWRKREVMTVELRVRGLLRR